MIRHAAVVLAILVCFGAVAVRGAPHGPYMYDEADYMYAASQGLFANLMDTPGMSVAEFVNTGLGQGRDASQRTSLSETIRASGDVLFYRHWHGPLYFDWLEATAGAREPGAELRVRLFGFLIPALAIVTVYCGSLWLFSAAGAALAAALFAFSYPVYSSGELAPHQMYVLFCLAALFLLARMMITGERRFWYGALVCTALAFCVLEIAFTLLITAAVCGHLVRDRLRPDPGFFLKSCAAFAATVLVAWPAAVLKLSFVKAYLFMVYLAVFRRGAWGSVTAWDTWRERFVTSPVEWALIAVAALLFVRLRMPRVLLPFGLYGIVSVAATFRVATVTPRYSLVFFPALLVFAAGALALSMEHWRWGVPAAAVISAVLATSAFVRTFSRAPIVDTNAYAVLDVVRQNDLAGKRVLAPQEIVPTLHYYFPETHLKGYIEAGEVPSELRQARFDGVIYARGGLRYAAARIGAESSE